MTAPPVLQVQQLCHAHPGEPPLIDRLSLSLGPGTHRLDGESGSGKTTLLRVLAGEVALGGSGSGWVNGQPLADGAAARQPALWWVDAGDPAFDGLTPEGLIAPLQQRHGAVDAAAWHAQLDGFGLVPHAFKTLHMLSTGMRRKAVLAVALAWRGPLLLLDEPTGGLDAPAIAWLVQALNLRAAQPQRATLMVCGRWPDGLACASQVVLPGA